MNGWSKTVADKFSIAQSDILNLFGTSDTHNSNERVRELWKYAASNGLSGTPTAIVDGVKLDETPLTADGWTTLFKQLFPTTEKAANFLQ